jgi:hypothetical protein
MTDHEILEQFFRPMQQMQVDDDGFTERVMSRLPDGRALRLSRLWTALCLTVAVVLFVLLRGWEMIGYGLLMLTNCPPTQGQVLLTAVSFAVIGYLMVSDFLWRERLRAL